MKREALLLLFIFLTCFVSLPAGSDAADLSASGAKQIKSAGVPLFPGAVFVNGNKSVGFRFATAKPPEEVQAWYRKNLAKWSLYDKYGGWTLYKGAPGADMGALMTKDQVAIKQNNKMNEWFGVSKAMSTEIVIMLPNE